MPYVSNMQDDDENPKAPSQGAVPATGGAPMQVSPSSGVVGAGASTPSKTPAGGQFASLNQYLSANQGKAEPLAGKVTEGIGKEYQGLEGQNKQTLANIGSQVSAQPDYSKANETIAQESANPVSFANNAGNVASFQGLLNASYAGPKSAESTNDYADQQAAINKAISQGESSVKTEAGREALLAKNQNRTGAGVTALNSAILSNSPTASASVEDAYKPFQGLLGGLQSGAAEQNKAIADRTAQAETAKKTASDALTSQMTGFNTDVTGRVTAAQQNLSAQNAKVKSELASGTPSDDTLKAVGITREQWDSLSAAQKAAASGQEVHSNQNQFGAMSGTTNIDLGDFLNQSDPNAVLNAGNVASKEDYDKAQAFKSLMGNLNLQAPDLAINPNAASEAGTAPGQANTFDYQGALGAAQQAKAEQLASAQAYVDALQSGADEEHAQMAAKKAAVGNKVMTALPILGVNAGVAKGLGAAGKEWANSWASTDPKNLALNVGTLGMAPIAKGIGKGVVEAAKTVKNIFCFHPDTLIVMESGSFLPIHKIAVGDMTRGGKVLATTRAVAQDFYWYNGVIVTGKHAVKENGVWVRVENSSLGHKFNYLTEVVCNLVTEKHRIYANGIEFADQYETDDYENLNMDQSLAELNRNA